MIEIHACTPYNPEFVKNFEKNELSFMVPIDIFWEVLLTHLRGIFISNAAKKKRERSNREFTLVKEIENLDELFTLDISDSVLEETLKKKTSELETLREIRLKGSYVRSRIRDCNLEEKPKFFF